MSRKEKDKKQMAAMCKRFVQLLDELYGHRDLEVASAMGYGTNTVLASVRKGTAFPDVERLERLVRADLSGSRVPNLHWLISGKGTECFEVKNGTLEPARLTKVTVR